MKTLDRTMDAPENPPYVPERTPEEVDAAVTRLRRLYDGVPQEIMDFETTDEDDERLMRQLHGDPAGTVRQLKGEWIWGWGLGVG